jgi:hypothetical protein
MSDDTLVIRDEDSAGNLLNQIEISLSSPVLTLRDVIAERVLQEIETVRKRKNTDLPYGLVSQQAPANEVDYEQELMRALAAFGENRYFVLIDDRQIEDLDEPVSLRDAAIVTFVRLIPIVGG